MRSIAPRTFFSVAALLWILVSLGQGQGQDEGSDSNLHEGFESAKPTWRQEETDATFTVKTHDRSARAAHEGRNSEHFVFDAGPGSALYYSMGVPKIIVSDKLKGSLYVRSSQPGIQLFSRVVLPEDLDPDTGRPSFLLVPGESVTTADRWQKLELKDVANELERQARVLRIGTKREVSVKGAYVERLVLNLYGGAGETEVFVDEMTLGPIPKVAVAEVPDDEELPPPLPAGSQPVPGAEVPSTGRSVTLVGNQILKDKTDWVMSLIDAPGADPTILRQHGFDAVKLNADAPIQAAEQAVRAGFLLVPTLPSGPSISAERAIAAAQAYPYRDHVAMWNLGDKLGGSRDLATRKAELEKNRKIISGLRDMPEGFPTLTLGTVDDFLPQYALAGRNLDVMAIEATDWASIRDPFDTYRFLNQRREMTALKNPRAPYLAWVNASAPDWASTNVWGLDEPPAWGRPQVQSAQIRQQFYAALSAGYRAIGVRADAEITSPSGADRLMELALLNAEIDLVESIIARGTDPIVFWPTFPPDPEMLVIYNSSGAAAGASQSRASSLTKPQKEVAPHPSIRAASIPLTEKGGRLLLVTDFAANSQFQPPQMAINNLKIRIQASENAQAFEITPAGIEVLNRTRTTGGIEFKIKLFSGTSMILVTTDSLIKDRLEAEVAKIAPQATEFAIRQSLAQITEATEVNRILASQGHTVRDANDLLRKAGELYQSAIEAKERMDYALAWAEAKHVGRTIRHLQYQHFTKANDAMVRLTRQLAKAEDPKPPYGMSSPVMSPPLTAFQTLPQHFEWLSWIQGSRGAFSRNLVPSGSFDLKQGKTLGEEGWVDVSHAEDDVTSKLEILENAGYGPKNSALHLVVTPKKTDAESLANTIPYLDHEALAVRTPPIPVHRGGFFRIRVLYRLNRQLPAATGGLIVRDSLGGKPYEMRLTDASPLWREITLYRFAPEDGEMTVTLGLAGYGDCYFDRLRVDTLTGGEESEPSPTPPPVDPIARRATPPAAGGSSVPRR